MNIVLRFQGNLKEQKHPRDIVGIQVWSVMLLLLETSQWFPHGLEDLTPMLLRWHRKGPSLLIFLLPAHHLYIPNYICLLSFTGWIYPTSGPNVDSKMVKNMGSGARPLGSGPSSAIPCPVASCDAAFRRAVIGQWWCSGSGEL